MVCVPDSRQDRLRAFHRDLAGTTVVVEIAQSRGRNVGEAIKTLRPRDLRSRNGYRLDAAASHRRRVISQSTMPACITSLRHHFEDLRDGTHGGSVCLEATFYFSAYVNPEVNWNVFR
jgi:hypothetical protein